MKENRNERSSTPAASPEDGRRTRRARLRYSLALTVVVFAIEVAGGLLSGSLALLADAAHMFADVGALILAFTAMTLADRPPTHRHPFGLYRAEILAAFVNAEILLGISVYIFYEAFRRFHSPPEIHTALMMWIAAIGLVANLISVGLLHGKREDSLNLRAVYLEVLSDALGSLGVLIAALVMRPTGWYWLDPTVSVGIGLLVLPRTISLLRQSTHILLEGTPGEVDLERIRREILEIPGVEELHDLHFWTLTSGIHSATVHVRAAADSPRGQVLKAVQRFLREEEGVDHATVQVEWGAEVLCETTPDHE